MNINRYNLQHCKKSRKQNYRSSHTDTIRYDTIQYDEEREWND